jgi:MoxR-like ATPase
MSAVLSLPRHEAAPAPPPAPLLPGLLASLGLFGLEAVEVPVLCALVTGDPLLLVGSHGAAKTALARALARLLGLRFQAYDASKALFEDLVGFPDPASLASGLIRYVPTPLSIWDREFVLLDELSRAAPSMQNKWLEVVRSRTVMGAPLPALRHVFAAMNPPDYLGAGPLDAALVGRFAWVVRVPEVASMGEDDQLRVVRALSDDDSPLLGGLLRGGAAADLVRAEERAGAEPLRERLLSLLEAARVLVPLLLEEHGAALAGWAQKVALALRPAGLVLDGRRLGMLHRNAAAALAVRRAAERSAPDGQLSFEFDELWADALRPLLLRVLESSLPSPATEEPLDENQLAVAEAAAWSASFGDGASSQGRALLQSLLGDADPNRALVRYEEAHARMGPAEHDAVVERFVAAARASRGIDRAGAYLRVLRLVAQVLRAPAEYPAELVARLLAWSARTVGLWNDARAGLEALQDSELGLPPLSSPLDALCARLSVELARARPGESHEEPDGPLAARLYTRLRPALEAMAAPKGEGVTP